MARGRKTALTIHLTPADRQALLVWQRSTTIPTGYARRGRIILLLADQVSISAIARTVGISRRFIYKWAQRFLTAGVAGLADAPRPGAPHGRRTPMRIAHGRWEQIQESASRERLVSSGVEAG